MALKRKRSSPNFSSPLSSASDASTQSSSPLSFVYAQSKPIESLYQKSTWSFPTYDSSERSHLNSRTRKRHRDDRPDDESIHVAMGIFLM
ncbi:hypothetical protein LTR37_021462 [Vermiconidia calcicola]|uniref:Uncharacterized protein n=1 Tax=Vermiconidia calcicola TaxID=1690605 RepID=A0ACC3MAE5_9PEZI|nr:hypothetical protein LTR37_021462 [Vermiconidia calcicola]